ncbi:MAG: metallophosphoesterase family protein [Lentimicrobiaceae bacterium]|nr:metallophosphoesterase family protein [Lentimicrobiaceae bacterium]
MEVIQKGKYGYLTITGDDGKVFAIADLHLGHANIIKHCNHRPFGSVEDMNEIIIANWNSVVGENDIVINLGDFIWRGWDWLKILVRLNGKQIFIIGNHDRRSEIEKAERKSDKFLFVGDMAEIRYNGYHFLACHYPLASWSGNYNNLYHIYGHTHENLIESGSPKKYNCCVELNDYTPQLLMDIKERIDEKVRMSKDKFLGYLC